MENTNWIPYILTIISISLTAFGMVLATSKGNAEQFSKLNTSVGDIKELVNEIKNDLKGLGTKIQDVHDEVHDLELKVTKLDGRVKALEDDAKN